MKKTKIFTLLLIPVIIGLAYYIYAGIKHSIDEAVEVKRREAMVIERLKEIREVQKWFLLVNGRYTASWDTLINFVDQGEIPIVEKKETITLLPTGVEEIKVTMDTLRRENVKSYLFPADKYPGFQADKLSLVPGYDDPSKKFTMRAGELAQKGGLKVDVVEVVDPFPYDKTRDEGSSNRKRRFLRFGSMDEVTVTGNWED